MSQSMSVPVFDFVVVGDEPYQHWVAWEYARRSEALGLESTVAVVTLGGVKKPTLVPTVFKAALGGQENASVSEPFHFDFVGKRSSFAFSQVSLNSKIKELPTAPWNSTLFHDIWEMPKGVMSLMTYVIRECPELVYWAQTMWQAIGRSEQPSAEYLVWGALMFHEASWWHPEILSKGVSQWSFAHEELKLVVNEDGMEIQRAGEPVARARYVLLCMSPEGYLQSYDGIGSHMLLDRDSVFGLISSGVTKIDLSLEKWAIPKICPPVLFFLPETGLCDQNQSFFATSQIQSDGASLALWSKQPKELSLEAYAENFRNHLGMLKPIFPMLDAGLKQISPTLGLTTCASESMRERVSKAWEDPMVWKSKHSLVQTQTRTRSMSLLLPFVHGQYSYPLNCLIPARKLVGDLTQRRYLSRGGWQRRVENWLLGDSA